MFRVRPVWTWCTEGFLSYPKEKKIIVKFNEGYFGSWSYFHYFCFWISFITLLSFCSVLLFLVKSTEVFTLQCTVQVYVLRTRCWRFPYFFLLVFHFSFLINYAAELFVPALISLILVLLTHATFSTGSRPLLDSNEEKAIVLYKVIRN